MEVKTPANLKGGKREMRTKDEILKDLGLTDEYNPRGAIVPDLADRLMIEALIDIRDTLNEQVAKSDLIEILFRKLAEAGVEVG